MTGVPLPTHCRTGSDAKQSDAKRSLRLVGTLLASAALTGCPPPGVPEGASPSELARSLAAAVGAEADDPVAAEGYLAVVDAAVTGAETPASLAAALAALDALVLDDGPSGTSRRGAAIALRAPELTERVPRRLEAAWEAAEGGAGAMLPFVRGSVAVALRTLALRAGDEAAAATWMVRSGCVEAATVVGPLETSGLAGLEGPSAVVADAPLAPHFPGIAPFATEREPLVVHADACELDLGATGSDPGLRIVVVDLVVPEAQTIALAWTSAAAATLEVGGARALDRRFDEGGGPVTKLATARVQAGTVRVVARVALRGDGDGLELDAWGEDGTPLESRAPRPGDVAAERAEGASPVALDATSSGTDDTLALAAGLMALGEGRRAEHLLEPDAAGVLRPPGLELLYARAVEAADDLPDAKQVERQEEALAHVLAAWPRAWEARLGHAMLAEKRRGQAEGATEALRDLDLLPGRASAIGEAKGARMLLAHGAVVARRAGLYDVSEQALGALRQITSDAPLVTRVEAAVRERVGDEAVSFACAPEAERDETGCLYARAARGDHAGALAELDRLRRLRRAPDALRQEEIALRLSLHDLAGALATYDALPAAERRMLETLGYAAGRADMPAARERLGRDRREARDSPFAMAPLVRALGLEPDPAPALEAEGRALVGADGRGAFMPGAATAVLRHLERYRIERDGFVHWLVYDLRRVGGTSDVASGGGAYGPAIEGKSAQRLLRLHVHKRDGRVLDPDPANGSSQASELSQLEQGDYVEQIVEGYALPTDRGQLVIDTPDLLPERTSIHEARVELRRPESLPLALWSHPLLGAPSEHIADGFRESVWQLADAPPRRIEAGVAAAERTVSLSLGTLRWEHVARAMAEQLRALGDHDPVVARFAREAAGPDTGASHGLVERLVTAVGKRVRVAAGGELSDTSALYDSGAQRVTARTILELGQGSRSWLVLRALGELGVGADLAVAETEPQDTPDYPPHVGRFRHPLVVVHLADGDLWIDADVDGPPLPPGRVSPELRGRTALLADGRMVTVEAAAADAVDEADMRLVLDRSGDATGTFVVTLRGRTAQSLADQLEVTVGTDRRELLRAIVTSFWPRVDVEDVSLGSAESSWEVVLQAKVAIAGLARPDGKSGKLWVVPGLEPAHFGYGGGRRTLGASYASQSGRESALSIDTPQLYAIRRRVELPPGAVAVRLPEVVDVRGAHLTAARTARLDGAVLEDEWTLALPTGTVASDAYPAFVEDVRAVDGGFMAGARIRTP